MLHKIWVQNASDEVSKGRWGIFKGESVLHIGHSIENEPAFLGRISMQHWGIDNRFWGFRQSYLIDVRDTSSLPRSRFGNVLSGSSSFQWLGRIGLKEKHLKDLFGKRLFNEAMGEMSVEKTFLILVINYDILLWIRLHNKLKKLCSCCFWSLLSTPYIFAKMVNFESCLRRD